MNKIEDVINDIRKNLDSSDFQYGYSKSPSSDEHKFLFENAGLEATLKIEGDSLYLDPVADLWGESKYPLQDKIMELMLAPLKARYEEDLMHITHGFVRDEEKSREGHIVFTHRGAKKLRDEKDVPYSQLPTYRAITRAAVAAKNAVGLGIIIDKFEPPSSSEKVEGAYHQFKLTEKAIA